MRGAVIAELEHIGAALVETGRADVPPRTAHEHDVAPDRHGRAERGPALGHRCMNRAQSDPVVPPAPIQVHGACSMVAQDGFVGCSDGEQIVIDADRAPEARVGIIARVRDRRHARPCTVDERPRLHEWRRDAEVIIVPGRGQDPARRAGHGPAERGCARTGCQCRIDAPRCWRGRCTGPHGQGCPSMRHAHEGEDRERVRDGRDLGAEPRPTVDCVTHGRSPDGRKPARSSHARGRDPGKPPEVR